MAVTRLKRKGQRNRTTSKQRISSIKQLTATPVIKNIDVEAIKEGFKDSDSKPAAKTKKAEAADTTAKKQEEPKKNHPTDKE
jgi:hypothetical protein